jgi:hypothetical protein
MRHSISHERGEGFGADLRTSVLCIDSVGPFKTSHFLKNMKLAKPSSFKLTMPFRITWQFIDVSE